MMNLMDFSQQRQARSPLVTIHWPANASIAVVAGRWRRLENSQIEASYHDKDELEICIILSQWLKEWKEELSQNIVGTKESADPQKCSQLRML